MREKDYMIQQIPHLTILCMMTGSQAQIKNHARP